MVKPDGDGCDHGITGSHAAAVFDRHGGIVVRSFGGDQQRGLRTQRHQDVFRAATIDEFARGGELVGLAGQLVTNACAEFAHIRFEQTHRR